MADVDVFNDFFLTNLKFSMTIHVKCLYNMSVVVRNPVFGVSTRSHTNRAVQPQKMARGLKFRI